MQRGRAGSLRIYHPLLKPDRGDAEAMHGRTSNLSNGCQELDGCLSQAVPLFWRELVLVGGKELRPFLQLN